jgi:exo-1,4-beta-D-glucosaminidase
LQKWTPLDHTIAEQSLRSQMYRLRSHPSLLVWLNGSDNPPPADVEKMYLDVEQQCRWPNPVISSATARPTAVTGESGVKMTGPYEYYSYDDRSIWVISSQYRDAKGLRLTAKVYNLDMKGKFARQATLDAASDSTVKAFVLPEIQDLSPAYFVVLRLEDAAGNLVGSNFYWLSTHPETLAWDKSNFFMTPTSSYADFTALQELPKVSLKLSNRSERPGSNIITQVTVENPSDSLAFFIRLKISPSADGREILPVLWQDNYLSLLPGEKREVAATYRAQDQGPGGATLDASGWNLDLQKSVPISAATSGLPASKR